MERRQLLLDVPCFKIFFFSQFLLVLYCTARGAYFSLSPYGRIYIYIYQKFPSLLFIAGGFDRDDPASPTVKNCERVKEKSHLFTCTQFWPLLEGGQEHPFFIPPASLSLFYLSIVRQLVCDTFFLGIQPMMVSCDCCAETDWRLAQQGGSNNKNTGPFLHFFSSLLYYKNSPVASCNDDDDVGWRLPLTGHHRRAIFPSITDEGRLICEKHGYYALCIGMDVDQGVVPHRTKE